MQYQVQIRAGTLRIDTRREDLPLQTLVDFASRHNPKRGFLFVSKVLGKHVPCRPSRMRQVYDRLAEQLRGLPAPIVVIGMAETATGLGGGVAHSVARRSESPVLYLHTTRHALDAPRLLGFDENHSHAPEHILYSPQGHHADLFKHARSLVLVDDEISTGRTLRLLAAGVAAHLPRLQQIRFVAIVNWLQVTRWLEFIHSFRQEIGFISLVEGEFEFTPDPDYRPELPAGMDARHSSRYARTDTGRTGLLMSAAVGSSLTGPVPADPLVFVGTGEFAFAPFLAAEALERQGHDVLFQSTTRSPIAEGEAIRRKLTFTDEHGEGVTNYIYNLPQERRVIVAYEHPAMAAAHTFPQLVDAQVWALA